MKILADFLSSKGDFYRVEVAAKYVVCPRCEGRGTHVNPSVDGPDVWQRISWSEYMQVIRAK